MGGSPGCHSFQPLWPGSLSPAPRPRLPSLGPAGPSAHVLFLLLSDPEGLTEQPDWYWLRGSGTQGSGSQSGCASLLPSGDEARPGAVVTSSHTTLCLLPAPCSQQAPWAQPRLCWRSPSPSLT